ncbi:MAG: bleomycin resistance protein [Gammaproteobacteria bacterium]|nr:bleomycin resistance protein [Gammaproteobacteria bacterium]
MNQALDFRYRRLGYVALNVTDVERSNEFYQAVVGLHAAGVAARDERLFRCSPKHQDIILCQAETPGLARIGWELDSLDDLDRLQVHLKQLGITLYETEPDTCAALEHARAFRINEPNTGAVFEYYVARPARCSAFEPTVTKIVRLGHVVLATQDLGKTEQFFREGLNYRVSDRVEGAISFMRCFPNPLHHSLGLTSSQTNRFHHVNFMVTDIDDIGRALYRFKRHNVPIVFGPGRHPPSDSIFLYFLDPDELTLEYSFGMEEFPETTPREPRLLPMKLESIDYWGAVPDSKLAARGEISTSIG